MKKNVSGCFFSEHSVYIVKRTVMEFLSHPIHEPIARRRAAHPSHALTGRSPGRLAGLPDPSSDPLFFHHSYEFGRRLFGLSSFMRLHDGPVWECVKHAATATLSERRRERLVVCTTPADRTTCTVLGKSKFLIISHEIDSISINLIKSNQNSINSTITGTQFTYQEGWKAELT